MRGKLLIFYLICVIFIHARSTLITIYIHIHSTIPACMEIAGVCTVF
ncbi:unnamed protein product [Haemonchus placei]|uniref:Uncharacterized protein n=1 Tax=Haemonchus placei TaxID=6290 RepID=A0A3P7TGD1_HAEPC|nr:unnamed protein product [Haemonchus placei]